jgi:hypothetical protein
MTTGIFKDLPRTTYLIEKKPTESFPNLYQERIAHASDEKVAQKLRNAYDKQLLEGYLDRAHETIQKKGDKTPKATLLEQLATVSKLDAATFSSQKELLTATITTYLQEDYLEQQIDHALITAQFEQFGIDKKHFPAYVAFWKQVYNLQSNTATFVV